MNSDNADALERLLAELRDRVDEAFPGYFRPRLRRAHGGSLPHLLTHSLTHSLAHSRNRYFAFFDRDALHVTLRAIL